VGYRDKPDFWSKPTEPRPKGMQWAIAGILCFKLGVLGTDAARHFGWRVSAELLQWLAIALGFACLAAAVVAYRAAKARAKRDVDDMIPRNYRG